MSLRIRQYPDPVLREVARPVSAKDPGLKALAADMLAQMHASEGVGLAAQQIGETRAICVIEVPPDYDLDETGQPLNPGLPMPLILLNPVIQPVEDETGPHDEGCLSFPGLRGRIVRPLAIALAYDDLDGVHHECVVRGFAARVIQHEVDHLNGVLFIDRMSAAKRLAIKGRLARMRRDAAG